jgi:hypothetical protein
MCKGNTGIAGKYIQWVPEMQGDLLAFQIKTFGLMEVTDPCVNTSIVRAPRNFRGELQRGKAEVVCLFPAKWFGAAWIQGPIGRTLWPFE